MFGPCCPWMGVAGLCQGHQGWNVSCKKSWTPFPCPLTLSISIGIRGWDVWCRNCSPHPLPLPLPLPGPSRAETTTRCMIKELLDTAIIADWKGPLFQLRPSQRLRLQKTLQFGRLAKDSLYCVRLDAGGKIRSRKPYYILPIAHWTTETGLSNTESVYLHNNFGADANLELLECTIVQLYHVHRCQGPVKSCPCVPRARPALIYCHQGFLRVRPKFTKRKQCSNVDVWTLNTVKS